MKKTLKRRININDKRIYPMVMYKKGGEGVGAWGP